MRKALDHVTGRSPARWCPASPTPRCCCPHAAHAAGRKQAFQLLQQGIEVAGGMEGRGLHGVMGGGRRPETRQVDAEVVDMDPPSCMHGNAIGRVSLCMHCAVGMVLHARIHSPTRYLPGCQGGWSPRSLESLQSAASSISRREMRRIATAVSSPPANHAILQGVLQRAWGKGAHCQQQHQR